MTIGEKIQYLRNYVLEMTQKQFAKEVTKVTKVNGLYQELISKYEKGKEPIREQHVDAFADFFSHRYGHKITKSDLSRLPIPVLRAKMEGQKIDTVLLPTLEKTPNSFREKNRRAVYLIIGMFIPLFCSGLWFLFIKKPPPPIVEITVPYDAQKLTRNNISVEGNIIGSKKGYSLWLFIEKHQLDTTYLWPKSEIETFFKADSRDMMNWTREIYHYPSSMDSILYGNKFSISLFVIPKNKSNSIKEWFIECKEIEQYPPLKADPLLEYRMKMVSDLELVN